ncbi:MAG: S8 family serine peptidase [Clostridia bacterium]|nr:S8 family serine peptidase [Clostridia bacterium]
MKKILKAYASVISTVLTLSMIVPAIPAAAEGAEYDDETVTFIVQTSITPVAVVEAEMRSGGYAKTDAFTEAYIESVSEDIEEKNTKIRDELAAKLGVAADGYIYTQSDSGFTITARRGDMDKILAAADVTAVYEDGYLYAVPDDEETTGKGANPTATTTEYKGQGTLIAIIDSGFQVDHPYLNASISSPKLSPEDAAGKITDIGYGAYYSAKIPFIYSYGNESSTLAAIATDPDHGTHVAGIAAGKEGTIQNGDVINGAAPEAQLALMACSKTANGSMGYSIVKKGIDDAITLGADVINMSLGSNYVDVRNSSFTAVSTSITNARNAGIVVCTSQGNAARGFYNNDPLVTNIDYGAAGFMGNNTGTFSVASADTAVYYDTMLKLVTGEGIDIAAYPAAEVSGVAAFADTVTSATDFVDCGYGAAADFVGKTLTNKVALIRRGSISFAEKTQNAKNAGAIAAIIYDNAVGTYARIRGCVLPSVFVTKADGEKLVEMTNKTVYAGGPGFFEFTNTVTPGKPSSFSSWGFSETMQLTPDITGYGGNVYSAAPGSTYQNMSGTSMSSPYLAGISACMKSYLNEEPFGALENVNTAELIQQLLMTTAIPITDSDSDIPYSPRLQGAGMVNLDNALAAPVVLYNGAGRSLVNLGDGIGNTFRLSFTAQNYSDTDVTFDDVSVYVGTDGAEDGKVSGTRRLSAEYVKPSVTVPAQDTANVTIDVTLNAAELADIAATFTNGFYIDGFVRLSNDEYYAGLPFSGLRGSWGSAPIWDKTIYHAGGSSIIYKDDDVNLDGTYLTTTADKTTYTLGGSGTRYKNTKYTIISPANSDGYFDNISAVFVPYRASHDVTLSLMDGGKTKQSRKITGYFSKFNRYSYALTNTNAQNNALKALPDGDYTFRLTGTFDAGSSKTNQTLDFPITITIDNTAPEISIVLAENYNTLDVTVTDDNYIRSVTLDYIDNSGNAQTETVTRPNTETSYSNSFTLTDANPFTIRVTAVDYAYNSATSDDYAVVSRTDGAEATAFKKTLTNTGAAETTCSGVAGTITSGNVTKKFEGAFDTTQTLESGSGIVIAVVVEGLDDNRATAAFELK